MDMEVDDAKNRPPLPPAITVNLSRAVSDLSLDVDFGDEDEDDDDEQAGGNADNIVVAKEEEVEEERASGLNTFRALAMCSLFGSGKTHVSI